MWIRSGVIVALLSVGCSKREEAAKVVPAEAVVAAAPAASGDIAALRAEIEQRENAGDDAGALVAADKLVAQLRAKKLTGDVAFAEALENYGRLLYTVGHWSEAEPVLVEALALPAAKTNPVLRSSLLFQLGGVYSSQRRNEDAIPVLLESLKLSEQAHGADSIATSNSAEALAGVYDYAGRYAEAEELFRRSLKLVEKHHGANSPELGRVLANLALNLAYQEKFDAALATYQRALPVLENTTGYDRSSLAAVHGGIGQIERAREKFARAEVAYRRALAVRIEALGEEHPLVGMDNYNLALVLEDQNKLGEALESCTKSETLRKKVLAEDHPHRVNTEAACARLREATARPLKKARK